MVRRRLTPAISRPVATVFGLLVAVAVAPLVVPVLPAGGGLDVGDIAPRTIEAPHAAQYESRALTDAAREAAAARVEPVYLLPDASVLTTQADTLAKLIEQVGLIRTRTDLSAGQQLEEVSALSAAKALSNSGRANLLFLERAAYDSVVRAAQLGLGEIMKGGVREDAAASSVLAYLAKPGILPSASAEATALTELLNAFVVPNVRVDAAATATLRDRARAAVAPVVVSYVAGQLVVREGETLAADDIEALRETDAIPSGFDYYHAAAGLMAALGFGLLLGFSAFAQQPFGRPAPQRLLLAGGASVAVLAAVRLAFPALLPDDGGHFLAYAMPVAAAPMLAASLGTFGFAAVAALALGLMATYVGGTASDLPGAEYSGSLESLRFASAFASGGIAGAALMARAERMSRAIAAAAAVAAATAATLLVFWLLATPRDTGDLWWIALVSALNGLGSSVLAAGLFVLVPGLLGITTRMHLYELAQGEHPLLRRLQEEAPGTYHHSLMVGTLAERAAANIGADPLLARVGAYYHDVGKLAEPGFFIENMSGPDESPHRELDPEASAAIIRGHVTHGIELARRARLAAPVRDFIPQHHGTRLVTYFYREAAAARSGIDPETFRYPGPRPATRESAIVMLADSCEAVVRAATDRGPGAIDEMVDNVVGERLAEGQFDDCDITLRELQVIGSTFKASLRAVYHPRIEYPAPRADELAAVTRMAGLDPPQPPQADGLIQSAHAVRDRSLPGDLERS